MENLENEINKIETEDAFTQGVKDEIVNDETKERISDMFEFLDDDEDIPSSEVLDNRDSIDNGISLEDIKEASAYWRGESERPITISKITSNNFQKLKDIDSLVSMYRMSKVPLLLEYQRLLEDELFKPERIMTMETKDLLNAYDKINKSISSIHQDTNQTLASVGSEDSEPNKLLDLITSLSNERYARLREFLKLDDGDSILDAVIEIVKNKELNPEIYNRLKDFVNVTE